MKLFCVKFKNINSTIIDVTHMFANDNKEVHDRLDCFLNQCREQNIKEYHSYVFFEVQEVDGLKLSNWFGRNEIEGNKVKIKR